MAHGSRLALCSLRSLFAPGLQGFGLRGEASGARLEWRPARALCSSAAVAAQEETADQDQSQRKRGVDWGALVLFVPSGIAALLCYWQTQRKLWKQDLLDRRTSALGASPLDAFRQLPPHPEPYTKVRATGVYHPDRALFIGPRPHGYYGRPEFGFHMVVPLCDAQSQRCVLVNRGWVPAAWADDPRRVAERTPRGVVSAICIVQPDEPPNMSMPPNDPASGTYHWAEADSLVRAVYGKDHGRPVIMAEGAGLPPGTPLLQAITRDADMAYVKAKGARNLEPPKHSGRQDAPPREPPLPKHEDALLHFSVMPDDHQMYAATWAIMSALTAIMARIVIRKAGRRIYYA